MCLSLRQLGEEVMWYFDIGEVLEEDLDDCEADYFNIDGMQETAKALRKLATKIDIAVKKGRAAERKRNA